MWLTLVVLTGLPGGARAQARAPLRIVAAENFYADVARQLAGPTAQVASILNNPDADPHLFETDAATARALVSATLVIYNGAGYDPWIARLLGGSSVNRHVIEVARLLPRAPLDNPHLWYDPATMPALARALTAELTRQDPTHASQYARRLRQFLDSLQPLSAQIATLRARYAGVPITATEPIANALTDAIGLVMRNQRFQLAIMNDTEPGARETAAFERSLSDHAVRLLIYNQQASDSSVRRLLQLARRNGVPIVGVTETEPPGLHYQQWQQTVLQALGRALAGAQRTQPPS